MMSNSNLDCVVGNALQGYASFMVLLLLLLLDAFSSTAEQELQHANWKLSLGPHVKLADVIELRNHCMLQY
jgi:hypothetical protein